jgi:hypothetical protein
MRRILAVLALLALGACRTASPAVGAAGLPSASGAGELVRHVVVFRFKPGATPEQVAELTRAFGALKDQIPGIVAFEHGVNNSPEGMNQGFTHVYVMTFTNAAARDAYLPHPAHKAFGALIGRLGIWDGGFVVDYVPRQ